MERPHLKYCGKKAQIELFIKLLSAVPELLEEIAPSGFEHSVYHKIYHGTVESDYRRYRIQRVNNYLMIKRSAGKRKYICMTTFQEFSKRYKPNPVNVPLEILNILAGIMGTIFCYEHHVVHHQGKRFSLTYYNHFEDCFRTAANKTEFFTGQRFTVEAIFDREAYLDNIDLSPIQRFIFKKLKELNMELFYDQQESAVMRQFLADLEQMMNNEQRCAVSEQYDPVAALLQELRFSPEKIERYHKKMLINKVEYLAPDELISAYIDVNGDFPPGYL